MPKVSVIVPVYNVEKYLKFSLDSVLIQTLEDIEVICINDCSTDKSLEILKEYSKKDSRVRIVNNSSNMSAGCSRNIGIKYSTGDFLAFIDPDDWIEKDRLEKMYNLAILKNVDIVETSFKIYRECYRKIRTYNPEKYMSEEKNLKDSIKYLLNYSFDPWSKLYRASLIKDNNIEFFQGNYAEVIPFTFKARILAKSIEYINSKDYVYRVRKGSAMHALNSDAINIIPIMKELQNFVKKQNLSKEFLQEFEEYVFINVLRTRKRIPNNMLDSYKKDVKDFLGDSKYIKYLLASKTKMSFIEKFFSVKNDYKDGVKYKKITFLGAEKLFKLDF